ncbi:MAG: hypothetical protein NTY77_00005 [Elusimicrobia bacterium]|nr:hypothetical protein [Elusimicrobiota bacterium]
MTPLFSLLAIASWSCAGPNVALQLYDAKQWDLVKSASVAWGDQAAPSSVLLLKSKRPAGRSGVGDPLQPVDLLVVRDGAVVYRFLPTSPKTSAEPQSVFFVKDTEKNGIGVQDVTNDGKPEIVFYSGYNGASRDVSVMHVLGYDPAHKAWRELKKFGRSYGSGPVVDFDWLALGGSTYGIEAESVEFLPDDPLSCNVCPKFYEYRVYRWEEGGKGGRSCFALLGTFNSEQAVEDPIAGNRPFILDSLKKLHIAGRRARPCP